MKFKELKGILASDEIYLYIDGKYTRIIDDNTDDGDYRYVDSKTKECMWDKYGEYEVSMIHDGYECLMVNLR